MFIGVGESFITSVAKVTETAISQCFNHGVRVGLCYVISRCATRNQYAIIMTVSAKEVQTGCLRYFYLNLMWQRKRNNKILDSIIRWYREGHMDRLTIDHNFYQPIHIDQYKVSPRKDRHEYGLTLLVALWYLYHDERYTDLGLPIWIPILVCEPGLLTWQTGGFSTRIPPATRN